MMSESDPESKDDFSNQRTGGHTQVIECENSSVLHALQKVKEHTEIYSSTGGNSGNEGNALRVDCGQQSIDNFIKLAKERCEVWQIITDRSAPGLAAEADTNTKIELLTLMNTYRSGLASLLQGKCAYHLLRSEYMEVYYYAKELENVASSLSKVSNAAIFLEYAKRLLSKKFVQNDLKISTQPEGARLLKKYADILQDNLKFIEKWTRNELAMQEYQLLFKIFQVHICLCDFQFSLDLGNRLLEFACKFEDLKLIMRMLAECANLYSLLGKYPLAYEILREMRNYHIDDLHTNCKVVNNSSVVELILKYELDSLHSARCSVDLAKQSGIPEYIACSYGNIGLALEYMGRYAEAIEPYKNCLQIGVEDRNNRVINQGLCNLGRAYYGLGDFQKAKEYFRKAVETPRPPKAYWYDTEDFRFSGDYWLAKLAVKEKNWDEASKQLIEVIKRCETLRKRIQDSGMKISFNDTQRKPFQYLQHVLLEGGKKMEALVVAEKGRGRDFFDKIESEFCSQLDSEDVLLDMIKSRNIAVLFISTLEDVGKLCFWFISSEGELLKQWSIPNLECNEIFTKLGKALLRAQEGHKIEFKGTTEERGFLIDKALELIKRDVPPNSGADSTSVLQPRAGSVFLDTTEENTRNGTSSYSTNTSREEIAVSTQEQLSPSDLIDQLSEVIIIPFKKELENLANEAISNDTPKLLIIPQGKTFNIPFASLKLNGEPLCNYITIIEAFSFNSFAYFTTESEKLVRRGNSENALIVGNPTHPVNLKQAEEEAKSIATFLDVTPLLREQATKEAVVERLRKARMIHFACHGETDGKGLVLACDDNRPLYKDWHLTVHDVECMTLDADLVVLSACYTARGQINSEGVLGLTRAFQIAGARSIVTALWAIPDEATKYFMEHFYGYLRHGLAIADAIRATQVTMQESQDFKEVINWGSFKVFGANAKIM